MAWGNRHFAPEGPSVMLVDGETGRAAEPVLVDRGERGGDGAAAIPHGGGAGGGRADAAGALRVGAGGAGVSGEADGRVPDALIESMLAAESVSRRALRATGERRE